MNSPSRRTFLKLGGSALVMIPIMGISGSAFAEKNAAMRTALKYQDQPGPEKKECAGCLQFVPGKTPTAMGGCKLYPGDTEIAPHGYCTAWVKKA
ncbi:MAG TPA: high-potential iron-sulfur protein [Rhodocyclaceae bacterium]|nr:high-potential iron-sulfur protein [Rhodocyclaceae bacterium]